jgi:hypothetical protein
MPLSTLCYRFYRCLFLRKPSYLKPSQAVGYFKLRLTFLTN